MDEKMKTLVLIKPDAVKRGLIGRIVTRFEERGLRITAIRMLDVDQELAGRLYDIHQGMPFFKDLVAFITSGPIVAMVVEGPDAVALVRRMLGATDPAEAEAGTIRGDFALSIDSNAVHASDAPERAEYEIGLFF
ncbi:MAG: nucleoside-diphosphate kinase [Actinomycetota bacterium]